MYKRGNLYGNPTCLRREPLDIPPVYRKNKSHPFTGKTNPTRLQGEPITHVYRRSDPTRIQGKPIPHQYRENKSHPYTGGMIPHLYRGSPH